LSQVKRLLSSLLVFFFFFTAFAGGIEKTIPTHKDFYLGLIAGWSFADYDSVTFLNGNTFGLIKETGVAPNIQIGYDFNRWTALELGLIYVHKPRFEDPNGTNGPRSKIKSNVVYLVLKPRYVFDCHSGQWYLFAKAGIGYVVTDQVLVNGTQALRGNMVPVPVYGAGIGYRPTFHWQVEATWLQTPANTTNQIPMINFVGVGAQYLF